MRYQCQVQSCLFLFLSNLFHNYLFRVRHIQYLLIVRFAPPISLIIKLLYSSVFIRPKVFTVSSVFFPIIFQKATQHWLALVHFEYRAVSIDRQPFLGSNHIAWRNFLSPNLKLLTPGIVCKRCWSTFTA